MNIINGTVLYLPGYDGSRQLCSTPVSVMLGSKELSLMQNHFKKLSINKYGLKLNFSRVLSIAV